MTIYESWQNIKYGNDCKLGQDRPLKHKASSF